MLPFTAKQQYGDIFEKLEVNRDISIGLEMNTLEEAFVNMSDQLVQQNP